MPTFIKGCTKLPHTLTRCACHRKNRLLFYSLIPADVNVKPDVLHWGLFSSRFWLFAPLCDFATVS